MIERDSKLTERLIEVKSKLIQLAMDSRALGKAKFAEWMYDIAAEIEERFAHELSNDGDADWLVHALSALSCWMVSDNRTRIGKFLAAFPEEKKAVLARERAKAYEALASRRQERA